MAAQVQRTFTRIEALLREKQQWALSQTEVAWIGRRLRLLRALLKNQSDPEQNDAGRLRDHCPGQIAAKRSRGELRRHPALPHLLADHRVPGIWSSPDPRLRAAKQQLLEAAS